jgi:hypothetical protein
LMSATHTLAAPPWAIALGPDSNNTALMTKTLFI